MAQEKEAKKAPKKAQKAKPKPAPSYTHVDTFLKTAVPMFSMSRMQAAGFKAHMSGRHYQHDEQVFIDELKSYLNLK